ncbi:MAG: cyclic nucleotide-binding domain-containing protein [Myxococcales bacterium]|nr:cyclic nucleotide-binding domain-containing protein [Myxococcales bacterium]
MGTDQQGESTPESEAAEEADWALATAEKLQARGDLDGARTWFRRAAEHLMDAGLDDRALVVAKQVAALSELPPAPTTPPPPVTAAPPPVPTAPPPVPAPPSPPAPPPSPPAAAVVPAPEAPAPFVVPPPPPSTRVYSSAPSGASPAAALTLPVVQVHVAFDPARAAAAEAVAALLVALPLFADLSPERVRSLARESVVVPLHAGSDLPLPPPGDASAPGPLWVLTEGHAQLTVAGIPVGGLLGPGDFVGELSAYFESGCLYRAEVRGEGRALCVAPTVAQALARQYEGLRAALEECGWERSFAALGHASSLLAGIDPALRAALYARFEPVQLGPGEALLSEGEAAGWVWLIAAGSVERYGGALGARVQRAGAGAAVGVASAWDDTPSGASVRARRTTLAARVRADAFRAMAAEAPGLKAARSRADVW